MAEAARQIAAAANNSTAAEIINDACMPVMKVPVWPTSEPNRATPSTLPVWRVAFSTPAAIPARDFSTLPSNVEVNGGTRSPSPLLSAINWTQIAH